MFQSVEFSKSVPYLPNTAEIDHAANEYFDLFGMNELNASDTLDQMNARLNTMLP